MRLKTKAFAIIFACVAMLTMTGVAGAWVYANGPIAPVSVTASVDIAEFSYIQGVYISSFEMLTSNQNTTVNSVSNDESKLTATMNLKSGSSQAKIKVNFFNNTNLKLTLQTVSGSVFDGIENASPQNRVVEAHQSLSCDVVFFANNNAQNVVFNFAKIVENSEKPVGSVMDGANSDNINTIGDGSKNISGDTAYRWTNWESVSGTFVAKDAVLALALSNVQQVGKIEIYHFVDAGKPYPCDFPATITVEYFDGSQYQTILVANLTKNGTTVTGYQSQTQGITVSQNWSNAVRTGTDKVYNMTINGNSANFASGYKGVAPCTTFEFAKVNTESLRVTFRPQTQTFVGIVEVVVG